MSASPKSLAELLAARMEQFCPSPETEAKAEIGRALIRLGGQLGQQGAPRLDHQAIAKSLSWTTARGGGT